MLGRKQLVMEILVMMSAIVIVGSRVENITIGSCYFVRILVGLRGSGKRTDDDFYISVPSLHMAYYM